VTKFPEFPDNRWQQVCDEVLCCFADMQYSARYIRNKFLIYRQLLRYLKEKQKLKFPLSLDDIDLFLQYNGHPPFHSQQKRTSHQGYYHHSMRLILEWDQQGFFDHTIKKRPSAPSPFFENLLEEYKEYHANMVETISKRRLDKHLYDIREFLFLLDEQKIRHTEKIRFDHVQAYFKQKSHLSPVTVSQKARNLRSFFKYLVLKKQLPKKLLDAIPYFRQTPQHLNAIWSEKTVQKLLSAIDRKTGMGKRDYAIYLLISQMGLRCGDVGSLRLDDIDWRNAVIRIIQQKTKRALELPLLENVATALIDYLKNGRPVSSSRNVFLSVLAPYHAFKPPSNLGNSLEKYKNKAGISFPKGLRQGFHSLRYSLATRLLENDTPLPTIAAILGHASIESTRLYAKTNVKMLRTVALQWKEITDE
jgi:integrase